MVLAIPGKVLPILQPPRRYAKVSCHALLGALHPADEARLVA